MNADIINFVEEEVDSERLMAFVNTLKGKHGSGSYLVTVPPGPSLADAIISSLFLADKSGAMLGLSASDFKFGVDASADPELAIALRVSMEEQRQWQEETWPALVDCTAKAGIASSWTEDLTMSS